MQYSLNIFLALLPVPAIYLLYIRYNKFKPDFLTHLEAFFYGVALASFLLLIWNRAFPFLHFRHPVANGFFKAALIEKAGAFILVFFLIKKKYQTQSVSNNIFIAMLLGTGFSAVENLSYAMQENSGIIIARFLSAVPLHTTSCGLIGYYISRYALNHDKQLKYLELLKGFLIPFLFHGMYDTLLFTGGYVSWLVGILLVVLIIILEYFLSKSQTYPDQAWLKNNKLSFEAWSAIQREPQYERWILQSMGSQNKQFTPLFQWQTGSLGILAIISLYLMAILFLPFSDEILEIFKHSISVHDGIILFSILPAAYATNMIVAGLLNPLYFKNSLIRIPIIADVIILKNGIEYKAITYDLTRTVSLLKTVDEFQTRDEIEVIFNFSNIKSPKLKAQVIWDNHVNNTSAHGTVVNFHSSHFEFRKFLFRYNLFKWIQGFSFNLKLPGFEGLRRLFVRPVSVMQTRQIFNKGTVLFKEDSTGEDFYLILKGIVEIYKNIGDDQEIQMALLGPGEIFGELALAGNQPRLASARCMEDCELAVAKGDNLEALIENNPKFTKALIENLSHRLFTSENILSENIEDSQEICKKREQLFHSALVYMLIASGIKPIGNTIPVKVRLPLLKKYTKSNETSVLALFNLLMRNAEMQNLDLATLDSYLSKDVIKSHAKYRLRIET